MEEKIILQAHRRLGHAGEAKIERIGQERITQQQILNEVLPLCEGCLEGRQTREANPNVTRSSAENIMDIVVSDVCGPLPLG